MLTRDSLKGWIRRRLKLLLVGGVSLAAVGIHASQQKPREELNYAVNRETFAKIQPGMSGWELTDLLGTGTLVSQRGRVVDENGNERRWNRNGNGGSSVSGRTSGSPVNDVRTTIVWRHKDSAITVTLHNDRVVSKSESGLFRRAEP